MTREILPFLTCCSNANVNNAGRSVEEEMRITARRAESSIELSLSLVEDQDEDVSSSERLSISGEGTSMGAGQCPRKEIGVEAERMEVIGRDKEKIVSDFKLLYNLHHFRIQASIRGRGTQQR